MPVYKVYINSKFIRSNQLRQVSHCNITDNNRGKFKAIIKLKVDSKGGSRIRANSDLDTSVKARSKAL